MFFNCSWNFAYEHGGLPTKFFLLSLPHQLHDKNKMIIDSRVHMLMPNFFPCIPGYHHDDVPREREDKQPEYFNPSYRSKHAMILFNGDICPTEFALGESDFIIPPVGKTIYEELHPIVEAKLTSGELKKYLAPSETIIYFDDRSWHQGTKAVSNGWRLFIRATWDTKRTPTNEIRRQVQTYLENPMSGW